MRLNRKVQYVRVYITFCIGRRIASLCRDFGREYLVPFPDSVCPQSTTSLQGKHLKVSFRGPPPHLFNTDPPTGVDVAILDVLAQRFGFTYTPQVAKAIDWLTAENGSNFGMIYKVRNAIYKRDSCIKILLSSGWNPQARPRDRAEQLHAL